MTDIDKRVKKRELKRGQQFLPDREETLELHYKNKAAIKTKVWADKNLLSPPSLIKLRPELINWTATWPLPVGFKSVEETAFEVLYSLFDSEGNNPRPTREDLLIWHMFGKSMPFKGNEKAGIILEDKHDDCLITFFGLVASIHKPYEFRYKFEKSKFDVKGGNPSSKKVIKRINTTKAWWAENFEGKKVKRGRFPKPLDRVVEAHKEYISEHGHKPSEIKDLANHMNLKDQSLKNLMTEYKKENKLQTSTWNYLQTLNY